MYINDIFPGPTLLERVESMLVGVTIALIPFILVVFYIFS